ncbi:ATP-binding protein [Streptomyces sp. NBC_01259]|uniref:ATP-binding protein n=1 Tax=Streptomyces sp. NBC_01259 TaxID=2903800 RepID=UPI003248CAE3
MSRATTPETPVQQPAAPVREFAMQFTSTPRGARLSRRLVSHRLDEWGHPYDSAANETLTLIAAELAANAIRHGHVPGRDFHVRLVEGRSEVMTVLCIEVADTRTERCPSLEMPTAPAADEESGRGLFLVSQLADRWGTAPRVGAPGKSVWAELESSTSTAGVPSGLRNDHVLKPDGQ